MGKGSLAGATQRPGNSSLHRLTRRLLKNYCKGVRPVQNWARATTVYLDLFVHAVLDVDAQNQKLISSIWYRQFFLSSKSIVHVLELCGNRSTNSCHFSLSQIWKDEYLTWNSSRYDGIQEISLPISSIWVPDIIIGESVDASRSPDLPYVYLNATGMIKHYKPMQVLSACNLEMYAFPFDSQNCSLTFSSALHTGEGMHCTSVFFTTCMALLVLSLSKSILLIKFLHLGEDRIREMLFASCSCRRGIDGHGGDENSQAPGHIVGKNSFPGGILLTSKDSGKKDQDAGKATHPLEKVLRELLFISSHFQALEGAAKVEGSWLVLSYKLDKLLFQVYLLVSQSRESLLLPDADADAVTVST
ncbi:hypothetical protein JD844_031596 [Phrynosoma platyrhinos]|uniref:Neurotransmitter-gated ion-channel ligand-binding domain-containing protein n=1 Tax=Phrynosoma platyrhinos TaxID=52577 RepID=A0ABQ7T0W0_PHRPL|nr:hypothetical protein JD844_031596 [Phrynosoma platyrhinos]